VKAKQLDDGVGDTLVAVDAAGGAAGGAQKSKLLARNSVAPTADRDQHQSIMDIRAKSGASSCQGLPPRMDLAKNEVSRS
jgi:hypothetical protein